MTGKDRWEALDERMKRLGIEENDLKERFIVGSGKGGQKLQKTSSCVFLLHHPTGIVIKCQQERQREHNRFLARQILCDKIETRMEEEKRRQQQLREKLRRQKRGRSRAGKEKVLEAKRRRGVIKKLRQKPSDL